MKSVGLILTFVIIIIGLVIAFLIYLHLSESSKSKYIKLHKRSVIFLALGIILITLFVGSVLINKVKRSSTSSSPADGFTIEEYNIVMDVNESNSVDVKEYITVNFYENGHHGINRIIPSLLEYTNKKGITQSKKSKISNLKAVGEKYTIDTISEKQRIKIGNEKYSLPKGNYTYEINYTYDMGYDSYNDFDEFIFHAFGDDWGIEIKNASITINLPKALDYKNKVKFFADKYRKKDITSHVNYFVSGNTIYANLSSNYKLNSALTIDVELPDNYFINKGNNFVIILLLICIACIIFAITSFILWKKNGKDLDKIIEKIRVLWSKKIKRK